MPVSRLHHVTVMSTNLERSVAFYLRILRLERLARPAFPNIEAPGWGGDNYMIHLNHNPSGTFKWSHAIDGNDIHFAVRVTDFEEFIKHLTDASFYETDDVDDPNRMIIKRSGPAGFPQVYVRDPDGNIIEINGATLPLLEGL